MFQSITPYGALSSKLASIRKATFKSKDRGSGIGDWGTQLGSRMASANECASVQMENRSKGDWRIFGQEKVGYFGLS